MPQTPSLRLPYHRTHLYFLPQFTDAVSVHLEYGDEDPVARSFDALHIYRYADTGVFANNVPLESFRLELNDLKNTPSSARSFWYRFRVPLLDICEENGAVALWDEQSGTVLQWELEFGDGDKHYFRLRENRQLTGKFGGAPLLPENLL